MQSRCASSNFISSQYHFIIISSLFPHKFKEYLLNFANNYAGIWLNLPWICRSVCENLYLKIILFLNYTHSIFPLFVSPLRIPLPFVLYITEMSQILYLYLGTLFYLVLLFLYFWLADICCLYREFPLIFYLLLAKSLMNVFVEKAKELKLREGSLFNQDRIPSSKPVTNWRESEIRHWEEGRGRRWKRVFLWDLLPEEWALV